MAARPDTPYAIDLILRKPLVARRFYPPDAKGVSFPGCMVWRYHPESRAFEIFSEEGGNNFGLEFDAAGSGMPSRHVDGDAPAGKIPAAHREQAAP